MWDSTVAGEGPPAASKGHLASRVGIDLEQFARDPYGSGIQRVLQHVAKEWPSDAVPADFIFPDGDEYALLTAEQALAILSIPFEADARDSDFDLRAEVRYAIAHSVGQRIAESELGTRYTSWLLPEVSYLPQVTRRMRTFSASHNTVMIGYDALPMTEPRNYRFKPGMAANVSDYFLLLASVDRVICISEQARTEILDVLRRPRDLITVVAHPGGDHIDRTSRPQRNDRIRFIRLGTLEARKMPMEILTAFIEANVPIADLIYIGGKSHSDQSINDSIQKACEAGRNVQWISHATDQQVREYVSQGDFFLAIGVEGYGIPVLESLALGTPVLFTGVQPAAEIMENFGATRLPGHSHEDLVQMFRDYAAVRTSQALADHIDVHQIPRWKDFVDAVAQECRP